MIREVGIPLEPVCLECGCEAGKMRDTCFLCHGGRKPGWLPPKGQALNLLDAMERARAYCPTRSWAGPDADKPEGIHGRGCSCATEP